MSLASDLSTLSSETKRRHPNIRKLADEALVQLKTDPAHANVLEPLLTACHTDPRLGPVALSAIQKVISSSQLTDDQIKGVVDAFNAVSPVSECQLRLLQCIPPLVENYRVQVVAQGQLKSLLVVCARLSSTSDVIVQNTAFAALQQLFGQVFDGDQEQAVPLFNDLVALAVKQPLAYFPQTVANWLSQEQILEILESVLTVHPQFLPSHEECAKLVRENLARQLLDIINQSPSFAVMIRSLRVLMVVVGTYTDLVEIEGELLISALNHMVMAEESASWQKVVVLEVFKEFFADSSVVERLYSTYDSDPKKKNVVEEMMFVVANLVENTNDLKQSTVHSFTPAAPSSILGEVPKYLSAQSAVRVAFIDRLDKHEVPSMIPSTYGLFLTFQTVLEFCDGMSAVVGRASESTNEEDLEKRIEFANGVISSTFRHVFSILSSLLYTRMDHDSFQRFIKSYQRFTHTVGLLGLDSARDKLLGTLKTAIIEGNSSLISHGSSSETLPLRKGRHQRSGSKMVDMVTDSLSTLTGIKEGDNASVRTSASSQPSAASLDSRQVVCLRAMANIVSHLGQTLGQSWAIVWTTLEWCDHLIGSGPDRVVLDQAEHKVLEISEYPPESVRGMIESLVRINDGTDQSQICGLNKGFFIDKLVLVSTTDPSRFIIDEPATWNVIKDHFEAMVCTRELAPSTRLLYTQAYNQILVAVAEVGFTEDDRSAVTADIVIGAMVSIVSKLYHLGASDETLTTNCESDIVLGILQTLHGFVQRYENYLLGQWSKIFELINTPFIRDQPELVSSTFETLKLVVSDLVQELPFDQLPGMIDTLTRFCNVDDINVSFSSVSYFWGVADMIRERAGGTAGPVSFDQLGKLQEGPQYYATLDLYLLQKLAEVTLDPRAQVRDGALQTVFQIIDGHENAPWDLVFKYCLDTIYSLSVVPGKEWLESEKLILSGLTSVYTKFLMDSKYRDHWNRLMEYLSKLTALRWIDLSIVTFTTFKDLLSYFDTLDPEFASLFFSFWTSVDVQWDFVDASYQEMVTTYMGSFPALHAVLPPGWDYSDVMAVLQKCATYPVLPASIPNLDDNKRPSPLQAKVLANVEVLAQNMPEQIIQFLSNIVGYPIMVRPRIAAKVAQVDARIKVPTFGGMSRQALNLLNRTLEGFPQFHRLVDDMTVVWILKPLQEVVRESGDENAIEVVVSVITRMMAEIENWKDIRNTEVWQAVLSVLSLNLEVNAIPESRQLATYRQLCELVIPLLLKHAPELIIEQLVQTVYRHSLVYADDIGEDIKTLVEYDFDATLGSTDSLTVFPRQSTRWECLKQLIDFLDTDALVAVTTPWFILRSARALYRYICDARLLAKCPMPRVQKRELELVLEGLDRVQNNRELKQLYPLLVRVDAKQLLIKLVGV